MWNVEKIVNLKPETYFYCKEKMADVCWTTHRYLAEQRDQTNFIKVVEDHAMGKLAECAYVNLAWQVGVNCSEPDFKVHNIKNFKSDLKIKDFSIHVKCQPLWSYRWTMREDGCPSWVCQPEDELTYSPRGNDYIALFSEIDKETLRYHGTYRAIDLIEMWKPPKKSNLKKKCLYLKDFDQLGSELF